MTNITNILYGNFLKLSEESTRNVSLIQSNLENEHLMNQLYDYSYNTNFQDLNYNLVQLDFGLNWLNDKSTNNYEKIPISNGRQVLKLADKKYGIFCFSGLNNEENNQHLLNLSDKNSLKTIISVISDLKTLFKEKNAILYIKNIEILEIFFEKEDLSLFFYDLIECNPLIKQIMIKIRIGSISKSFHEALMIMSTSMIQVQSELFLKESKEVTTQNVILQLTQKKGTGYSFQQLYKCLSNTIVQNQQIKVEKITNVNDLVQQFIEKNQEKDLQKAFNTTFSIQMTQQQKQNVDNMQSINPHFEAMQLDNNWNNFDEKLIDAKKPGKDKADLITLEGEDIDQEIEDDDDFDV